MRNILVSAIILAWFPGHSLGDDLFSAGHAAHPNHLVPMCSFMDGRDDYDELLARNLFVTTGELGRMLVRPSFRTEFCLSVDVLPKATLPAQHELSNSSADPFEADNSGCSLPEKNILPATLPAETGKEDSYRITVTTATKSTWRAHREAQKDGAPLEIKVERVDRMVSRDLAVAIQRVWAKTLLLTRYPRITQQVNGGSDGTTYQFSVFAAGFGVLQGQTWSPERGLPLELTKVGLELIAFARQDASAAKLTEDQLIKRLREFEPTIPQQ